MRIFKIILGSLIITGDVVLYLNGEVEFEEADIIISEGASLKIYLEGEIEMEDPSFIDFKNLTKDPSKLQIYSSRLRRLKIGSTGEFYGTVYAPRSNIRLYSTGDIYGSFISRSFTQRGSSDGALDTRSSTRYPSRDSFLRSDKCRKSTKCKLPLYCFQW